MPSSASNSSWPLCESVSERIERYAMTAESVRENADLLDLLLMPIFQIGEIVGSGNRHEALQELHPSDVWTQLWFQRTLQRRKLYGSAVGC